jgi:hypothetical protein
MFLFSGATFERIWESPALVCRPQQLVNRRHPRSAILSASRAIRELRVLCGLEPLNALCAAAAGRDCFRQPCVAESA